MPKRAGKWIIAGSAAVVLVIAAGLFVRHEAAVVARPWQPTAEQVVLATDAAQYAAEQYGPETGIADVPLTGWPSNVRQVTMIETVGSAAAAAIDSLVDPGDPWYGHDVFVIQLTGDFSVRTTPTTVVTGQLMTIVIDAHRGFITDLSLDSPTGERSLTGGYQLFPAA